MSQVEDRCWQGARAALAAVLLLGATSCHPARFAAGPAVHFIVRNFAVEGPLTIRAGAVRFVVDGAGPTLHEFNVARTNLGPNELPLAAGGTVDDKVAHSGFDHITEVDGIDMGQHKTLAANLSPGRYVLYCNMDGHYQQGMTTQLVVTGP